MTKRWLGATLIGAIMIFTAVVYGSLPERIATHWNMSGEVDGWSSRFWAAALMPCVMLAMWLLLPLLRKIDPRRTNYERFDETFWLVINMLIAFMGLIHVLTLGSALGWPIDMSRAIMAMLGLMFIALGNYLPRVRSNWWMGIRTPWTMESETVWRETHRVAGFTFVAGGVVAVIATLLPAAYGFGVGLGAVMLGSMVPVAYSYIVYRRERSS